MNRIINFHGNHYIPSAGVVLQKFRFENILFSTTALRFGKPNSSHKDMEKSSCLAALRPNRISFWMEDIL